jgi:hypothetical protein
MVRLKGYNVKRYNVRCFAESGSFELLCDIVTLLTF